ncbi:hypothetical protein Q5M87_04900 [Brachyspira innocens]|uniref:Uncharacterized protein n=1 Tax=Brachyspira innocens TaxID=13264 RepID=A0ABT8YW69_9SPIR|nr:hypothetical protein [Brachyspira innocens]MDO6993343.1 hypothetical protein [Brachyspira innocens]MDO7019384.1 hypothetical protein [Brachyspira innocens]
MPLKSIYTEEELIEKIKAIDEEIAATGNKRAYTFGDGQINQSVTYKTVDDLMKLRKQYMDELKKINPDYDVVQAYSIRSNLGNRMGHR